MVKVRYNSSNDTLFVKELNSRIDNYFSVRNLNKRANKFMFIKTILMLSYFFGIYFFILFGGVNNLIILGLLWALLGVGQALLGMTIMHDKVHGAYSTKKWMNFLLEIPVVAIGVDSFIWSIEHNFMHHNYPNIEGIDQDIHPRYLFRFSKYQPKKFFHRFQHIYASFFYSLLTLEWVTIKDFIKIRKYYNEGFVKSKKEFWYRVTLIFFKKVLFFALYFIIPMLVLSQYWAVALIMFAIKTGVSGFIMTVIFQTGHVVPNCEVVNPNSIEIRESWHRHQLNTTSNFSQKSKVVTYLLGGLNFQIEHHLFPGICHVYYPEISNIVKETAKEFNMPYLENDSVWSTISMHFRMLKILGRE
jgi:linoleoyl-CoA desaturase